MHKLALLACVACATTCCSHDAPRDDAPHASLAFVHIEGTDVTHQMDGIRIEVDGSVTYRFESTSSTGAVPAHEATIAGHPFGVRAGLFFLGPREYGAVREGSLVQVSERGVSIDGTARGPLPEPLVEPTSGSDRP